MQAAEYQRLNDAERRLWWFRALHSYIRVLLPRMAAANALDIGCGTGGLLARLADWGQNPMGIDFSPQALQFAKHQGAPLAQASADDLPFASASFDLVTCVDVLEVATVDPIALVENAFRVLRPGGYALFVMAAHQWLLSEHDRAVNSVRRFSLNELRALISGKDFLVHRSTYLFFLLFPVIALRKLLNRPHVAGDSSSDVVIPASLVNEPLYWLCKLESVWLRFFSFPIGSSVLILAQKNA